MVPRQRLKVKDTPKKGGVYFDEPPPKGFISSGCARLDCELGGGWALGRVANVVGDRSTGKTLLAIEACANFLRQYPKGKVWYREAEAAFDESYASSLGLPIDQIDFGPEGTDTIWETIEDIFEDMSARLSELKDNNVAGLYIIDSLDALSSRAEMDRKPGEASFSLEKQKMLGMLFRKLIRQLKAKKVAVLIISQVRDNIGVSFGEKHKRVGGRALDFYASQILWLSNLGAEYATIKGVKRAIGVKVKAKCKKNKIARPFGECEMFIEFGYGVRDEESSLEWLAQIKALAEYGAKDVDSGLANIESLTGDALRAERKRLREFVVAKHAEIEGRFAPTRKKYE